MKDKIIYIFLDIDGVLDNEDYWWECFNRHHVKGIMSCDNWPLDPKCLLNLMLLYQYIEQKGYEPKIILSSSWRLGEISTAIVNCRLAEYGMRVYDKTTNEVDNRGNQIQLYLENYNKYKGYLILDDEINDITPYHSIENIIHTTFKTGFDDVCLIEAKQKVNEIIN